MLFKPPKRVETDIKDIIKKANSVVEDRHKGIRISGGSLLDKITGISKVVEQTLGSLKENYLLITEEEEWLEYCRQTVKDGIAACDCESTGLSLLDQGHIVGFSIQSIKQKSAYIPTRHVSNITEEPLSNQISKEAVIKGLQILLEGKVKLVWHNYYYDAVAFMQSYGVMLPCYFDTQEAGKLLNENDRHNLKMLYDKYIMEGKAGAHKFNELFGGIPFCYIPPKIGYIYGAHDSEMTLLLYLFQIPYLTIGTEECTACGLDKVSYEYWHTELPCLNVLVDMKIRGINYSIKRSKELQTRYEILREEAYGKYIKVCEQIKDKILAYNTCNKPISFPPNPASAEQISAIFYKILGAKPPTNKKKDDHTAGKKALKNWIKNGTDVIRDLASSVMDVKAYDKCLKDFIIKLSNESLKYGGKIHGNFNLNGAKKTGRLSSSDPKQNWAYAS